MAAPTKYNEVMSVIKRRIQEGDYLVESIPGERRLAEETGVSYMTARRAVRQLLEEEVLTRDDSGSLAIHPTFAKSAILIPNFFAFSRMIPSTATRFFGARKLHAPFA